MVARPPLALPCGMAIAPQFSSVSYLRASLGDGTIKVKGRKAKVPIDSAPGPNPCQVGVKLFASGSAKGRSAKKKHQKKVIGKAKATIPGGQSKTMKLKLSKRGGAAVKRGKRDQRPSDHDRLDRQHRSDRQGQAQEEGQAEEAHGLCAGGG